MNAETVHAQLKQRVRRNLRRLRLDQKLSFQELGERAKLTPGRVERIETGQVEDWTLLDLIRLAIGLGVDVTDLTAPRKARPRPGDAEVAKRREGTKA